MSSRRPLDAEFLANPRSRWRNLTILHRIATEILRGMRRLHFVGPAVTVFGSARVREGSPEYTNALAIGRAAWRLGAGRATKDDPVSASAGIEVLAKPGVEVRTGDPVLRLHAEDASRLEAARALLLGSEPAVVVSPPGTAYSLLPLVVDIID